MDKKQILKECGYINKSKVFVIMGDDLDNFLYRENIFSYVFPYKDNINYTIFKVR